MWRRHQGPREDELDVDLVVCAWQVPVTPAQAAHPRVFPLRPPGPFAQGCSACTPALGTLRGQDEVLGPRRFCGKAHRPSWGSPGGRGSPCRAQAEAHRLRLPSCPHRPWQGALVTPGRRRPGWADLCWGPTPASLCCREPGGSWVAISGAGDLPVCFASPGAGQGGTVPQRSEPLSQKTRGKFPGPRNLSMCVCV